MGEFYRSDPATLAYRAGGGGQNATGSDAGIAGRGDQISHGLVDNSEAGRAWRHNWGGVGEKKAEEAGCGDPLGLGLSGTLPDILRFSAELAAVVRVNLQTLFPCYDCNAAAICGRQRLAARPLPACNADSDNLTVHLSTVAASNRDRQQNCSAQGCWGVLATPVDSWRGADW